MAGLIDIYLIMVIVCILYAMRRSSYSTLTLYTRDYEVGDIIEIKSVTGETKQYLVWGIPSRTTMTVENYDR